MTLRGKNFLLCAAILLAAGCGPRPLTPSLPTAGPTPEPLATLTSAPTAEPSAVPAASSTAEAPLRTNGPYLAYFRQSEDGAQGLVLMDADGKGRKVVSLPSLDTTDIHFISPDGKWLAYYLGSASEAQASDLTLNLLNLENGETQVVSKLLSKDYPDNFVQAAKELNDPNITPERLRDAFLEGIARSIAWSPDGSYLAFASQLESLSSDVYLYHLGSGEVQRLTHGPDEVGEISWSPRGEWVIASGTTQYVEGGGYNESAISVDGLVVTDLPYRNYGVNRAWYNNHAYIDYINENVIGDHHLRLVDIKTAKVLKIWDGPFDSFTMDAQKGLIIVLAEPGADPTSNGGIYLINIGTNQKQRLDNAFADIYLFGLGDRRFLTKYESEAYFILEDGTFVKANPELDNVSVASNQQHWISVGTTLKIFDANNTLTINEPLPFDLPAPSGLSLGQNNHVQYLWRPDSSGLFIAIDTQIYSLDILTGKSELVETNYFPNGHWMFTLPTP